MQELRIKFIQGAQQRHHIPLAIAEQLWELMAAFAGYGFPKAHAASYALAAWRSAWCKTHFPAEFLAAVMANWGGYYSQRVYLGEARRMKLKVHPPHVNHSRYEFTVSYPQGQAELYMGLGQVRDLTQRSIGRILQHRPFHSFDQFMQKVTPRAQEGENLIRCGALSGLGSEPTLLKRIKHSRPKRGQLQLFADEAAAVDNSDGWDLRQRLEGQQAVLGVGVEAHPLEIYDDQLASMQVMTSTEALNKPGTWVRIAGLRQSMRRSRTTKGHAMAFLSLEDTEGMVNVVVFPQVYGRFRTELAEGQLFVMEGIMERDEGGSEPVLHAEKIQRLDE